MRAIIEGEGDYPSPFAAGRVFVGISRCCGTRSGGSKEHWGAPNWGWLLGAWIAGGAFVAYLVSHAIGLAGFEEAVGDWAEPVGNFSLIIEGLYLTGYFSVATIGPRISV